MRYNISFTIDVDDEWDEAYEAFLRAKADLSRVTTLVRAEWIQEGFVPNDEEEL